MLKDSLGGNARSTLVATVTTSPLSISETISTLRFASRAKLVKTRATVNQLMEAGNVAILQDEIRRLQEKVLDYESGMGGGSIGAGIIPASIFEFSLLSSMQARVAHLDSQLLRSNSTIGNWKLSNAQKGRQLSREKMITRLRDGEVARLKKICAGKSVETDLVF
jgi:hypothetical protein